MASTQELISRIYLSFDGAEASQEVIDSIVSVEVDDSLILPDMFAIHLQDPELRWIDNDTFSVGKSVEISTGKGATKVKILSGEITGIEPRFLPNIGPSLMLRGYDMSHRLNRGKKTTTYIQMTDGDIAKKVAQNAGLSSKIDPTRQVNEYVIQDNKTDWEFLISRTQRIGYRVLVKDGKLHFVELPEAGEQTPTLKWGEDLVEFNARLTTARQVTSVIVQGWDPDRQQQIVGEATQPRDTPDIGERSQDGGQAAERAFGGSTKEIVVDRPVATQEEANILAQAICDEIGQGFIEAECVSFGNPAIQAGVMIRLEGLGSRFSGTYRVTHALHRYDTSGYTTEFTIGGRYASTISELLSTTDENDKNWGPVLGVVTNNDDPDAQGRVKVKIPSLKDSEESNWARLVAGGAGNGRGFQCMPEVGDEVLVVFEHEDIHKPLIIGGLWSDKYKPPTASNECLGSDGVKIRQMVTRTGTKLVMDDENNSITISNPDEKFCLKISESDRKVEIVSDGDVVVNAQQNVQVEAQGNVTVTGQQVEVNAKTNAKITASANMNLEASGVMTIKGATIQLN